MTKAGIEALIEIGGNGSQTVNLALSKQGFPTVGIASSIDNDLVGSIPQLESLFEKNYFCYLFVHTY